MQASQLIYPMFAMVLLTATVLARLFRARVRSVREGVLPASYFRTFQGGLEPDYAVKPARHFANLFEAPTLFYAVCLAAMVANAVGPVMLALAWCYVGLRLAHAYIHLGANRVRYRVRAYFASWLVLVAMWADLAVGVAMRGAGGAG
jgi:hypothetical protein